MCGPFLKTHDPTRSKAQVFRIYVWYLATTHSVILPVHSAYFSLATALNFLIVHYLASISSLYIRFACAIFFLAMYKYIYKISMYKTRNSWGPFLQGPKNFSARKAVAKSQTFWLQSCFMHISLILTKVPFIQEVSGVCTSLSRSTD